MAWVLFVSASLT